MNRILMIVLAFCALSLSAAPLSLEQARARALEANLDLQSQQAATAAAHWDYRQSMFGLLPTASLTGGYMKLDPEPDDPSLPAGQELEDNTMEYGLSVNWPVFVGGAKWLGSRVSRNSMLIADQTLLSTRLEVVADAESKYYAVLEARDLLRNAEVDLEAARRNAASAKVRYELGALSRADYLQLESEAAGKEVSLIRQRNLLQIARLDLANHLQMADDFTLEPAPIESHRATIDHLRTMAGDELDALTQTIADAGAARSPALRMASLGRDSSEKGVWMARGAFLPTVSLAFNKTWTEDTDVDDDFDDSSTIMLNASVPLFPIADNYAAESSARRSLRKAQHDLDSADDSVRLGLRSGVLNLVAAAQAAHASEIALEFAQETYLQMEERFRSNLISATDLLSAEVLLLSSRNRYTTSVYDFLRARSALAQQMGVGDAELANWLQ